MATTKAKTKTTPAPTSNPTQPDDPRMIPARDIDDDDVQNELASGGWIKKKDLAGMGQFNIIGASKRNNVYKKKQTVQIVFEIQFLEGDERGEKAMCSMEENVVREKYFNAVKKYGAIGPVILGILDAKSEDMNAAFVFCKPGEDPNAVETGDGPANDE